MNLCYLFVVRVCDEELWRDKSSFIYRKGPRLTTTNKKKEHTKKAPKKKRSDEKKNMENTHTRVNMLKKREVVLHKKCRKKNPFSTLLSSVSFFRPTHTTTRTRTTLTTTTRIYIYIYLLLLPMDGLARDEPFPTSRGKTDAFLRASETVAPRHQAAVVEQTQE